MRVLVCGSRTYLNGDRIRERLAQLPTGSTIIAGAARGADTIAANAGRSLGYDVIEVPADWDRYGKSAGLRRNVQMLEMSPDLVIAFWDGDSRGTAHTMREARSRGITVEVVQ